MFQFMSHNITEPEHRSHIVFSRRLGHRVALL